VKKYCEGTMKRLSRLSEKILQFFFDK